MALITPRTPPGTMELLPRRQITFQRMLDTIRRTYERFGFLPLETPVFEVADVLLSKSGGETEKQVYFVQSTGAIEQGHKPDLALRFDLTVPTARYVAQHERELAFPFRRYQMQRVYRGERAQKGRYREFYQCDIDVIGKDSLSVVYDAEMPAVIYTVFTELAVGPFQINFNNRKILLGMFEALGITDPGVRVLVLRQVDKLDKLSRDEVLALLQGDGIGLSADNAARVLDMIGFSGPAADTLAHLDRLGLDNATFLEGVDELRQVIGALTAFGVPETHWRVNLAIARGLDYYTGTVYETFLTDHPGFGSVCSGGRYENLAGLYTKSKLPGVGISIGLTRLFYALEQAGIVADGPSTVQALVTQFDADLLPDYLAIGAELRAAGINTEIQLEPAKPKKQFAYADKAGIRYAIIMGTDEKAKGEVLVKDMVSGEQASVPRADLAAWLKQAV
ncbi:histidine--tRNA ligase [Niveispirillum sp. BGYR6]|uniref:histidine--tRNA ligase n=1 Tax=Niveispirillum sp. BGYR6 TaxID=2971249 RepID=UPI0022B95244|nr:histidine--tRNA ligase [Niveispirillum sp. BGYR6]MDG5495175.1 histidine--tRNA ligase [Niveispirillum sp. BGYR6]